jgi:hypothetical protein
MCSILEGVGGSFLPALRSMILRHSPVPVGWRRGEEGRRTSQPDARTSTASSLYVQTASVDDPVVWCLIPSILRPQGSDACTSVFSPAVSHEPCRKAPAYAQAQSERSGVALSPANITNPIPHDMTRCFLVGLL